MLDIAVLIGADHYWDLVEDTVIRGNGPTAVKSKLGYLLSGLVHMGTSCTVTVIGNVISSGNESDQNSSGDEDNQKKGTPIVKPTYSNRRRWRSAARSQPPDPLTSLPVEIADDSTIDSYFTKPWLSLVDVDEMENTNNRRRQRLRTRKKSFPDPRQLYSLPEVDGSKSEVPHHLIPDRAMFDYKRLEVEPNHGDRQNKKKLEECVRKKVKTKGEPNKNLQKQTTSKYSYEYEADSTDSLLRRTGGDRVITDETAIELILEVPEVVKDEPSPLLATAMPQTIYDRKYNMALEVIIRIDGEHAAQRRRGQIHAYNDPKERQTKEKKGKEIKGKNCNTRHFLDLFL
ncbi:hypothetical protein DPMN_114710 [Dreissena polymorpha]|uniref:Uncharacterized protein n=1 Tax=Dreissena polymorpha TaxID=45954 RepID=A0A9D4KKE9_DREPO|nr:hypothetical protein DPMN_114710 [Dreissena polymorpha]